MELQDHENHLEEHIENLENVNTEEVNPLVNATKNANLEKKEVRKLVNANDDECKYIN